MLIWRIWFLSLLKWHLELCEVLMASKNIYQNTMTTFEWARVQSISMHFMEITSRGKWNPSAIRIYFCFSLIIIMRELLILSRNSGETRLTTKNPWWLPTNSYLSRGFACLICTLIEQRGMWKGMSGGSPS